MTPRQSGNNLYQKSNYLTHEIFDIHLLYQIPSSKESHSFHDIVEPRVSK